MLQGEVVPSPATSKEMVFIRRPIGVASMITPVSVVHVWQIIEGYLGYLSFVTKEWNEMALSGSNLVQATSWSLEILDHFLHYSE